MGLRADMADAQWQAWLRALQVLNLALFIAAEHQGLMADGCHQLTETLVAKRL